jgi:hypothetical protein
LRPEADRITARFTPRWSAASTKTPRQLHRRRPRHLISSFAVEKRKDGHVFQLNFSDSFATTMGQIARGGPASKDWFLRFNLSRKPISNELKQFWPDIRWKLHKP